MYDTHKIEIVILNLALNHNFLPYFSYNLGPVVQNLTKSLVKVTLKFLSWNMANMLIFFAEKSEYCKSYSHFPAKISMYLKMP